MSSRIETGRAFGPDMTPGVERLLEDPRTAFVVVTTLETAPSHEARFLAKALIKRNMSLGAIVANRVLPAAFAEPETALVADRLRHLGGPSSPVVTTIAERLDADPKIVDSVLTAIGAGFDDAALVASREIERRTELESLAPTTLTVPWIGEDIHDLAGLSALAEHLRRSD